MKALAECPNDVVCEGRAWRGRLRERKGGLTLEVVSAEPFALHLLDDDALITSGERSDGVLITESSAVGTCFVELKGAIDPADPDHPFRQVQGSVEHFAPEPRGAHGGEHHAAWRAQTDRPDAPPRGRGKRRALAVSSEHVVTGMVVLPRAGTRVSPRWLEVAGRQVFVTVVQRHGSRGVLPMTMEEIEQALE